MTAASNMASQWQRHLQQQDDKIMMSPSSQYHHDRHNPLCLFVFCWKDSQGNEDISQKQTLKHVPDSALVTAEWKTHGTRNNSFPLNGLGIFDELLCLGRSWSPSPLDP